MESRKQYIHTYVYTFTCIADYIITVVETFTCITICDQILENSQITHKI